MKIGTKVPFLLAGKVATMESRMAMTSTKIRIPKVHAVDPALQRLAGAVLIQALEDLTRGPKRSREDALNWILGRTTEGFNFGLCCDLLGREPNDVLQRVQRFFFIPTGLTTSHASCAESLSYFLE